MLRWTSNERRNVGSRTTGYRNVVDENSSVSQSVDLFNANTEPNKAAQGYSNGRARPSRVALRGMFEFATDSHASYARRSERKHMKHFWHGLCHMNAVIFIQTDCILA